jgi:aminoglycoside phosphotransferase (APT) family kinase protein
MNQLLARGRAADVFVLDANRVLKRDREGRPAEHEAQAMQHVRAHGYPVPEVFDASGTDLVMERIEGPTMTSDMARRPWRLRSHARLLADLHERLHAIPPPPGASPRLGGGPATVHGDFHSENVLMATDGPVVIDWANAGAGRAEDDVALAWLILAASDMPGGRAARLLARLGRDEFLNTFLQAAGREAATARLAELAEVRVQDPHVLPHEREAIKRVVAAL